MSKVGAEKPISTLTFQKYKKDGQKIACLTAYDYSTAKILDQAGVDLILVGDSLAMVALGHPTTHAVTMDEMVHHTRAVVRGVKRALVVADMPFMSYQVNLAEAVSNAGRFVKEAGAQAVKLEGATKLTLEVIERLVSMGIPVVGHLGFTPQSINSIGGTRVQGKSAEEAFKLIQDCVALERVGCFCVVLEMVPTAVASLISRKLTIPTIGIGAGSGCDGQILVTDDLLGKFTDFKPRFVRQYANLAQTCAEAVARYADDVRAVNFPGDTESFAIADDEAERLRNLLEEDPSIDRSELTC